MLTKMSEFMAGQSRLLSKLPTVRGVVNQKIRDLSDDQTACRSASHLDAPREREKQRKEEKLTIGYQVGAPMKSHGRQLAKSDGDCILADVGDCLVFDRRLGARSGPGRYRPCCCRHLRNSL